MALDWVFASATGIGGKLGQGGITAMRKEKNAKIYRSVDWRLAACLLALWLLAMVLLTIAVAEMI